MKLMVFLEGRMLGEIEQDRKQIRLTYSEDWRSSGRTRLSLSMPPSLPVHRDDVVRPFLWGLLPDNERVLERWARRFQVSARDPFMLLHYVGEDCAGAVQLVTSERVDAILAGDGGVDWLDDEDVARRLKDLRIDPAAWSLAETGQFSLAGAQAKTALHYDSASRRWGYPRGATPTTHILKPAVAGFAEHDLNEHLCLAAANRLGIRAAKSTVTAFGEERVIVVERYDRIRRSDGVFARVHQEDMCQALGRSPTDKCQNDGGPTPEEIAALLGNAARTADRADSEVGRFAQVLAYNWLVAGTDGHAKNYSMLLSGQDARLAPMYDVASILPYDDFHLPKVKMAMKIGGEYRLEWCHGRHWRRLATSFGLDPDRLIDRIDDLAARLPDAIAAAASEKSVRELKSPLPDRMVELISKRAEACRRRLDQ